VDKFNQIPQEVCSRGTPEVFLSGLMANPQSASDAFIPGAGN